MPCVNKPDTSPPAWKFKASLYAACVQLDIPEIRRYQLGFRYAQVYRCGDGESDVAAGPDGYPEKVDLEVEVGEHHGMAELGQRQIQLADGLFDQMRGLGTQTGDDHHEIAVGLAGFVATRGALVQRLGGEHGGIAARQADAEVDAVSRFCLMVVMQGESPWYLTEYFTPQLNLAPHPSPFTPQLPGEACLAPTTLLPDETTNHSTKLANYACKSLVNLPLPTPLPPSLQQRKI